MVPLILGDPYTGFCTDCMGMYGVRVEDLGQTPPPSLHESQNRYVDY